MPRRIIVKMVRFICPWSKAIKRNSKTKSCISPLLKSEGILSVLAFMVIELSVES
jgi:hypothetical protein